MITKERNRLVVEYLVYPPDFVPPSSNYKTFKTKKRAFAVALAMGDYARVWRKVRQPHVWFYEGRRTHTYSIYTSHEWAIYNNEPVLIFQQWSI